MKDFDFFLLENTHIYDPNENSSVVCVYLFTVNTRFINTKRTNKRLLVKFD